MLKYKSNIILNKTKQLKAFTIVELLIVIVVIGILAAITIVSFGGITSQANVAAVKSDLNSNSRKLQLYYTQYGSYPTTLDGNNCPSAPTVDTNYCLKVSTGTTLTYQLDTTNTSDYALYATKGSTIYKVTSNGQPFATSLTTVCPQGFIVVPGSSTYSTSDFCVMKYEAKCALTASPTVGLSTSSNTYSNLTTACTSANSRGIVSTSSGFPIANIDQTTSTTYAANTIGCSGCTLMSEAQRLTIAQNVLSNPVNWSGNAVGSGYIYSGNNDGSPGSALVASDDSNGYFGTNNTSGNQKRTLTLTNGETIWDLAGNAAEWTSGQKTGGQPGASGFAWREWTAVSGGTISPSPFPATTGLSGASTWNSSNGIGQIPSDSSDATLRGFLRGGAWVQGSAAGVLALALNYTPTFSLSYVGFRVAR